MSTLLASDWRFLNEVLQMGSGYCLDFSNITFTDFFADVLNYDIMEEHNSAEGSSKGKRMRYFLRMTDDRTAAKLLRALWEHRASMPTSVYADPDPPTTEPRFMAIVAKLEGSAGTARTDAIDRFVADETLEELVSAIQRDVDAGKPETALDRLHTYCMKKLAHLVTRVDPKAKPASTLSARLGQYLGVARKGAKASHPVSFEIMTSAIKTFELFNSVRNDRSLAHDNPLIERAEARFIFDAIVNVLRFIKATEGQSFETVRSAPASVTPRQPIEEPSWDLDDEIPF